jgi:hypothetical protein
MKVIYNSVMKDKLGEGLQLKSQDELVINSNTFKSRVRHGHINQIQSRRALLSADEQFYEVMDNHMQSSLGSKEDYMESVN